MKRKKEYEGIGVKEYYILDARGEETAFYRLADTGRYRKIKPVSREIIRSEVLPGFQFRISDLYRKPSLEEMTEDELYQGYVLPFHQKIKLIAEQERQRAELAEKSLILERERAESLARKLKELGVEV